MREPAKQSMPRLVLLSGPGNPCVGRNGNKRFMARAMGDERQHIMGIRKRLEEKSVFVAVVVDKYELALTKGPRLFQEQ